VNELVPRVIFVIPGIEIKVTETVVITWVIMAVLTVFAMISTRNLKKKPGKIQNAAELIVEYTEWLVDNTMGSGFKGFAPYIGTLSLYLLLANTAGVFPGLRSPSSDLNTPAALALISFLVIHYYGFYEKGTIGYVRSFFAPVPLLFPMNLIGELAFPVSLGFRLFGNMVGALVILELIYSAAPALAPVIPHIYFDLFAGLIQAFIFAMLTMTYLSLAVD